MGVFDGLNFCISGKFTKTQPQITKLLNDAGAIVHGTVNKHVEYLLGDGADNAKHDTARNKGLPIVTEEWVNKSIKDNKLATDSKLFHFKPGQDDDAEDEDEEMADGGASVDDDDEEEEVVKPKGRKPAKAKAAKAKPAKGKKAVAPVDDEEDDDGDDGEEDEEDVKPKGRKVAKAKAAKAKPSNVKAVAPVDDEEDEDDEDDDQDDEDDVQPKGRKAAKAKPAKAKAAAPAAKPARKRKADVLQASPAPAASSGKPFDGLVICISGSFPKHTQAQAKNLIMDNGGKVANSFTKAVTHVIAANDHLDPSNDSAKMAKARDTGIPIMTADWLDECIEQGALLHDKKFFVSDAAEQADDDGADDGVDADDGADDDVDGGAQEDDEEDSPVKPAAKKAKKAKAAPAPASPVASPVKASPVKMKTITIKGKAPVDDGCPVAAQHHVYEDSTGVWDAMLNQTNIGNNNNKFYIIQLLQNDSNATSFCLWTRWGRVGSHGQSSLDHSTLDGAKRLFEKKFLDKTKNHWSNRDSFTSVKGKYTLIERDYSNDNDDEEEKKVESDEKDEAEPAQSKLPKQVQQLISLICDVGMMKRSMIEMGYDANKLPLGKLSKDHVKKGYAVLTKIADVLNKPSPSNSELQDLSSEFYTLIPHSFGMRKLPVIKDVQMLKEKIELCESLGEIEVAMTLMKNSDKGDSDVHELDRRYEGLKCHLHPLPHDSEQVKMIQTYIKNTHGSTHTGFELELENVFEVKREGEHDRFSKHEKNHNRQLLWHGSRLTNWTGILSQGLRCAPPNVPVTGYMFGKGVYFADACSKSAGYCFTSKASPVCCMLLSEVALGNCNEKFQADYNANNLPKDKHSTKGLGSTVPDDNAAVVLPDGLKVPLGPLVEAKDLPQRPSLLYNEYIVYDESQIRMKYLLQVRFKHRY